MKRSAIVILVVIAGITAMIWAGVMAYRQRKSTQVPSIPQVALVPASPSDNTMSATSAAAASAKDPDSPAAQGLPDLRGKQAPAFTLKNVDGKNVSLADYKGKAVLINFWATWCAPCKLEMPWLIDLQKKYAPQGFTVLGVSEDDPADTPAKSVAEFATKMNVDYPVLIGDDAMSKSYGGIDYLPTSYYIGRDGKVLVEIGGLISSSEIEANIQKILATNAAKGA